MKVLDQLFIRLDEIGGIVSRIPQAIYLRDQVSTGKQSSDPQVDRLQEYAAEPVGGDARKRQDVTKGLSVLDRLYGDHELTHRAPESACDHHQRSAPGRNGYVHCRADERS